MNTSSARKDEYFHEEVPPRSEEKVYPVEVKLYLTVFGILLFLTFLSVALWALRLPVGLGIILALFIAVVKVSLIVSFFMHALWLRVGVVFILVLASMHCIGMIVGTYLTEIEKGPKLGMVQNPPRQIER